VTSVVQGAGRDLAVLVGLFAVSLVGFVVCTTPFSAGAGLAVVVVGLFVLLACLAAAGWTARMDRALLRAAGVDLPGTRYPALAAGRWGLGRLAHPQSGRDLLHVLVSFPVSLFSFSVAVSWVLGGLGGITYWFWSRWLRRTTTAFPPCSATPAGWPTSPSTPWPGSCWWSPCRWCCGPWSAARGGRLGAGGRRDHGAAPAGERADLGQQVSELTESRTAAGEAEVHTLRRLERDLHDGPQQRLVRLGMDITAAQRRLDDDPVRARALLDETYQQSQDALAEIRGLSRGIAPPILAEQGLRAAVTALAARGAVPTTVDVDEVALAEPALNAAYFVVAEALTNVEKHSRAAAASVEVHPAGAVMVVTVGDDGIGGASAAKGHGMAGLGDRLLGVGGSLTISRRLAAPRC